ncbi:YtnP family quorum-quenching lactonase [Rubeoparvulum massiliense]|uniref:YtnP family quorum-quenching lactonase n=1 Tax=Rubeoparvulum massiliense TaxID=1631346 RepID=UPI00065E5D77|nr:MBL fold metallo-hydrolase [Rubeoparvulum massiliense]
MEQLQVGKLSLTWLNGGNNHLDGGAMFGVVPKPLWSRKYPFNHLDQIELRTDPVLIQHEGKYLLIDSGIGNGKLNEKARRNYGCTEESKIHQSLAKLGLTVNDIDGVLMTHLHFDHASGLTELVEGEYRSTFPRATIYTSEIEWKEMRSPNLRSRNTYWRENWETIQDQVVTFEKELEIMSGISMHHTGGHSDGHGIIRMASAGDVALHMGDLMGTHAHRPSLWVMAYDDYPMTSIAAKEAWVVPGMAENAWFTFYHDAYYRAIRWSTEGEQIDAVPIASKVLREDLAKQPLPVSE